MCVQRGSRTSESSLVGERSPGLDSSTLESMGLLKPLTISEQDSFSKYISVKLRYKCDAQKCELRARDELCSGAFSVTEFDTVCTGEECLAVLSNQTILEGEVAFNATYDCETSSCNFNLGIVEVEEDTSYDIEIDGYVHTCVADTCDYFLRK